MSNRETILSRIRTAVGDSEPPTREHTRYPLRTDSLIELLADRLRDYGTGVHVTAAAGVAATIGAVLAARGAARIGVAGGIQTQWLGHRVEFVRDPSVAELGTLDGVLTTSALAIAETGTIILDGGPGQGIRALTLVPDYHLCIVDRIVGTVAEAVSAVIPSRPLTWISGPSATSDIELTRVEGVHGPRTLDVICVYIEHIQ